MKDGKPMSSHVLLISPSGGRSGCGSEKNRENPYCSAGRCAEIEVVTSSMGRVLALNAPAFLDLRDVMVVNIYKLMKQ